MTLTAADIERGLRGVTGAVGRQMVSMSELAAGANSALAQAPAGLTVKGAAAFLATMAQESMWFRVTEEIRKNRPYAPYIGRTFEQVTHRPNYLAFGRWCKAKGLVEDAEFFVNNPKRLADYQWAWLGGVWYFEANGLWPYANRGDFLAVSRGVNMGNPRSTHTPAGMLTRNAAYKAFLAVGDALLPETKEPTVATRVIDGTEYTLRSSRYGTHVLYQNKAIDPDDLVRLLAVSKCTHGKKLRLTQGGLSDGALSGNTHLRLHVYDVDIDEWTTAEVWDWCKAATVSGIRPFPRGFTYDSFQGKTIGNKNDGNEHLHVLVWTDYYEQGHPARYQQVEYDAHGDGLVGTARYTGPWHQVKGIYWKDSPYNPANRVDGLRQFKVTANPSLLGLDFDRQPLVSREQGSVIDSIAVVKRWGRENALTKSGNFYAMDYLAPVA